MSGSASLELERSILSHTLAIAPMATPSNVYVALCLSDPPPSEAATGTEASGGGYARTPATFALLASPASAASNAATVEFPVATTSWGTIGYFELWTQPTGGTRLYWGPLTDPADGVPIEMDVAAGDIVRFSAGTLFIQAAEATSAGIGLWFPLAGNETITGPITLAGAPATASGSAIQALLDALSADGGTVMLAPNTVYDVTAMITTTKPNVRITAPSWGTILRRNAAFTTASVLWLQGVNSGIDGFTVDGNSVVGGTFEVSVSGANTLVSRMQIINSAGTGHLNLSGQGSRATGNTITGLGISLSTERGYGIWAISHATVLIDDNTITGCGIDGIGFDGEGSRVIGNRVSGCHCWSATEGGQIGTYYGGSNVGNGLCIIGNTIGTPGSAKGTGIEVWNPSTIVSGNTITGIEHSAITIFIGNGATITGNSIRNCGGVIDAIVILGGVSDFVISGNRIADDKTTHTMRYGVSIYAGASDRYSITGNLISGYVTAAINDLGTGINKTIVNNQGNNDASLTKYQPVSTGGKLTVTGNVAGVTLLSIDAAAASWRGLNYSTNGLPRWQLNVVGGVAETGGNVGGDLALYAMSDGGGSVIFTPLAFARSTGLTTVGAGLRVNGNLGFGVAPVAKPTVSGAKGSNAALASLLTALAAYGLITDSSTA